MRRSERASWGPVVEATWSAHCGVVVPMPTRKAPEGEIAAVSTVEVAHFEFGVPPPEPQSAPVPETTPSVARRHCVPVMPEMTRFVVEAVVAEIIVVDAKGKVDASVVEVAVK